MALLIKYNATDDGTRPITGRGTTNPFWESPSLFIAGGVDAGTVEENQTVSLNATVWNTGQNALTNVRVQMWVCDYTTLPTPTLTALPLDAMGTTIARGFVTTVPPGVSTAGTIVPCFPNWRVAAGQVAAYNGHLCLVANVYLDDGSEGQEGSDGTNPFYLPGPPATGDFCANPHHAQRNIAIQAFQQMPDPCAPERFALNDFLENEYLIPRFPRKQEILKHLQDELHACERTHRRP